MSTTHGAMAMDCDDDIFATWRRGKHALDTAKAKLSCISTTYAESEEHSAAVRLVNDGNLIPAIHALSPLTAHGDIIADLTISEDARTIVWSIAAMHYGKMLERKIDAYGTGFDHEEILANTWDRMYRKLYTWRAKGKFRAWLDKVFRRALKDYFRRLATQERRYTSLNTSGMRAQSDPKVEPGTTETGVMFSLEAFTKSLSDDRRAIWDRWISLHEEDLSNKQIQEVIAHERGSTCAAVRVAIARIRAEFAKLCSGADLSWVVGLWLGTETRAGRTVIIAKGIGVDDNLKLVHARPVSATDIRSFCRFFATLRRWGLAANRRIVMVVDNSQGLAEAIQSSDFLRQRAIVQLCVHCVASEVVALIPPRYREGLAAYIREAYYARPRAKAEHKLCKLITQIREVSHPAAEALRSKLSGSIAVKSFGLRKELEQQFLEVRFSPEHLPHDAGIRESLSSTFAILRKRRSSTRRQLALAELAASLGFDPTQNEVSDD